MSEKYMHLIDGEPARFDGEQICYADKRRFPVKLVDSLIQIRKEQRKSKAYRKAHGFHDSDGYGYAKVIV